MTMCFIFMDGFYEVTLAVGANMFSLLSINFDY